MAARPTWTRSGTFLLAAALAATGADAQSGERGRITGSILDASSGAAIRGAMVVLQPEVAGAFPGPATGSSFATATRAATSDSAGIYRFDGLPAGVYRLYVSRYSYRPYSVVVELRSSAEAPVSVGLEAAPISLSPVQTRGQPRGPYVAAHAFDDDSDLARLWAVDLRRRTYLTTDVRELTHADVIEAVTLGEPDVLRALQRLPGVSTRSDYTAELWTRGAPWSHTRVYFDGVPVFNPLHALGMISGIGSSSVGAVWFHPGVRSAGIAEGAAGVVDLQSRRAEGAGELNAQADASLMTAGFALDQRVLGGSAGWMLAGRRTYLDWLADLAGRAAGREDESFPYGFAEVAGRVDAWLGARTLIEASWLWEADELRGEALEELDPLRARWGNALGRVTLGTRAGGLSVRHTLGASLHSGLVGIDPEGPIPGSSRTTRESESRIGYLALTGSVAPEPASLAGSPWALGYALEYHAAGYFGPRALPVPRPGRSITLNYPDAADGSTASSPLWWNTDLPVLAVWGERTWSADDRLAVRGGLRVETSDALLDAGTVRAAPRLSARYSPIPEVALSAGVARIWQYAQALAPGGVHLASLISTDIWLLAGPAVPALSADVATLGLETWIAPARHLTLNTFVRSSAGVATPDPRPGPVLERATFVTGEALAYGVEASVRQLAGPVTGSASYSLGRSRMTAAGIGFPGSADRTHVFDITALVRARPSLRLGAAFTAATGVPFTPTISTLEACDLEPGCDPDKLPWAGAPLSLRAPTFASLDLLADWSTRVRGTDIGVYAQLRNALGRENGTVYTGDGCLAVGCGMGDLQDAFERGVPRLPVIGVRVRR